MTMSDVTLENVDWYGTTFTLEETEIHDPWLGLDLSGGDETFQVSFSFDEPFLWNSTSNLVDMEDSLSNEMSFNMAQPLQPLNTTIQSSMIDHGQPENYPQLKEQDHSRLSSTDQPSQYLDNSIFEDCQIPGVMSSPSDSMPSLSDTSDQLAYLAGSMEAFESAGPSTRLASPGSSPTDSTGNGQIGPHVVTRETPRNVETGHICHVCRAKFETKRKLSTHQRQHSKPEKCPVCGKQTALPRDLNRHIWTDHEDYAIRFNVPSEARICPVLGCGMTGRKDNLPRHCLSKHGMKLRWRRGEAVLEKIDGSKIGAGVQK